MEEIFKECYIENYGYIKVNNLGTKIIGKTKELALRKDKDGYLICTLSSSNNGTRYSKVVKLHRLVAELFIPNLENKPQVNHIDGNKENNCVDNLEWCTNQENSIHAVQHNLRKSLYGENHGRAKLTEKDVIEIREYYSNNKEVKITDLANNYNVIRAVIYDVIKNNTWKYIN